MKVTELNREQLTELKQRYYTEKNESVSYGELADIDSIVTDNEIFEEYNGIEFTEEDFFSSVNNTVKEDFAEIFRDVEENANDFETLNISFEILKIARDRLDKDLNDKEINAEYTKLNDIIKQLGNIINSYK
jgi:hypothetical protein